MMLSAIALACLSATWFAAWIGFLRLSIRVTRHDVVRTARARNGRRLDDCYTVMLTSWALLVLLGLLHHAGVIAGISPANQLGVFAAAGAVAAIALLSVGTHLFPALPGRRWLSRLQTVAFWTLVVLLAGAAVLGLRAGTETPLPLGAAAALALTMGFTLSVAPHVSGVRSLVRRVVGQGSHPAAEATLKRLTRRTRPLIVAAGLAHGVALALLALPFDG